jgi:hypothetical protein
VEKLEGADFPKTHEKAFCIPQNKNYFLVDHVLGRLNPTIVQLHSKIGLLPKRLQLATPLIGFPSKSFYTIFTT